MFCAPPLIGGTHVLVDPPPKLLAPYPSIMGKKLDPHKTIPPERKTNCTVVRRSTGVMRRYTRKQRLGPLTNARPNSFRGRAGVCVGCRPRNLRIKGQTTILLSRVCSWERTTLFRRQCFRLFVSLPLCQSVVLMHSALRHCGSWCCRAAKLSGWRWPTSWEFGPHIHVGV